MKVNYELLRKDLIDIFSKMVLDCKEDIIDKIKFADGKILVSLAQKIGLSVDDYVEIKKCKGLK